MKLSKIIIGGLIGTAALTTQKQKAEAFVNKPFVRNRPLKILPEDLFEKSTTTRLPTELDSKRQKTPGSEEAEIMKKNIKEAVQNGIEIHCPYNENEIFTPNTELTREHIKLHSSFKPYPEEDSWLGNCITVCKHDNIDERGNARLLDFLVDHPEAKHGIPKNLIETRNILFKKNNEKSHEAVRRIIKAFRGETIEYPKWNDIPEHRSQSISNNIQRDVENNLNKIAETDLNEHVENDHKSHHKKYHTL